MARYEAFRNRGPSKGCQHVMLHCVASIAYLDGLCIKFQALLFVDQEFLNILSLITLELNHLAHLGVDNNGAIAGKLLLDHFEDLLLVKFLGETLDCSQGFATIALCYTITSDGVP